MTTEPGLHSQNQKDKTLAQQINDFHFRTLRCSKNSKKYKRLKIIPRFIERRISHRPNLVRIADNIGWLFFDKILRMGVGLLVSVWIARHLGPEQFGLLNFAIAFASFFGAIAGLGLNGIVVRDLVRDPYGARSTLGTAALLHLIGGLVTFIMMLAAIAYVRPDDVLTRSVVAILGAVMMLKVSDIAVYWFESQVQAKYTVWVQNGVFVVFAMIRLLLILQEAPLIAFAWAMLGEAAVVAMLLLTILGRKGIVLSQLSASIARAKTLLADSWSLIISAIAITLYMRIDQIMLGQMIGDEAVGVYSAAVRISEVWYFIPMAIVASVFPALLETKKRSEAEYNARLQRLYDVMVIISIAFALPMTFIAAPIVGLLYGASYIESGPVLALHIWASVFVFLGVASGQWFITENRQILAMQRTLLGALVNVCLNLWLIPSNGATGAAAATVFSYAVAAFFADLFARETRHIFVMKARSLSFVSIFNWRGRL